MRGKKLTSNICLFACSLILLTACDQTFQPLQKNNRAIFSMHGYLDASADTQWVSITPSRNQLEQPPVKPEMNITLTQQQNGNTAVLNDSLFQISGLYVVNSWTTADVEPGETYWLTAERPDGATSSVSITIPPDFPTPQLFDYGGGCRATLQISGVERLADVQSRWHIRVIYTNEGGTFEEERFFSLPLRYKAERPAPDNFSVFVSTFEDFGYIENAITTPPNTEVFVQVLSRDIFVASGGPEWNEEIITLNDIEYALPEGMSNIENGLGYMMGIVSKTISYIPPLKCLYNDNPFYKLKNGINYGR